MDKTALEEFAIALYEGGYLQGNGDEIQKLLEHHLEIEKEQIEEAYFIGGYQMKNNKYIGMHDYYNETYGGNKW